MSAVQEEVKAMAAESRRNQLRELGIEREYDAWLESMPNARIDDAEAYMTFMEAREIEQAAIEGRLSVTSRGQVVPPDTDIPTPGPDGEKDGPDGAGDTSEGGEDDSTALKIVPGMWTPPPESEAVNYEPPPTSEIVKSQEWVDNARKLWEFMGEPNTKKGYVSPSGNLGTWPADTGPMSDKDIAKWAKEEMSMFNWNVVTTLAYAQRLTNADDPETALAFLNLLNMYDHSDGGAAEFGRALGGIGTDPTTYAGLGLGTAASKGAARTLAKKELSRMLKGAIIAGTAGAVEGGMLAGGFNLSVQNIEQEAGARKDIDKSQAAAATGLGVGLGGLLGLGGGAFFGRRADKFAKAVEEEMTRQLGGEAVEAARQRMIDEGLQVNDFITMLNMSEEAAAKDAKPDPAAILMREYLTNRDTIPLKEDGTVDTDAVVARIEEMHAAAKIKADRARVAELVDGPDMDAPVGGREIIPYRNQEIGTAGYEENGFKGHPATAEAGRTLNDNSIAVKETTRDSIVIDADEIIGNYDHLDVDIVGPMIKMAEDMGLRAELKDPGNLTITGDPKDLERFSKGAVDLWEAPADQIQRYLENTVEGILRKFRKTDVAANDPDLTLREREERMPVKPLDPKESEAFANRIAEMHARETEEVVARAPGFSGSIVKTADGKTHEVVGKTGNGWYRLFNKVTGHETNVRRKDFMIEDAHPAPRFAGPMELKPFTETAAKIIEMNEQVVSGKLVEIKTTHVEQQAMAKELQDMGVNITAKQIDAHWSPSELLLLRDVYDSQAKGMADLARFLNTELKANGFLTNEQLAMFNMAHAQFVATRDLFYGVSGNAARQLNILRSRPTDVAYDFNQTVMDAISIQGGRANTERAVTMMAEFAHPKNAGGRPGGKGTTAQISKMSDNIWGDKYTSAVLIARYNMMLSSWRTHFFNFLGNSASGIYQHFMVSPVRMGINNLAYARDLARAVVDPKYTPDPADRMTRHQYYAELRGHYAGFRDSLSLAKEIAMGRDIGEGKVWNELGLRYNVINVPNSAFGKMGTTPVRLLEAGDAFFKNQYYTSKIHELSSIKARYDEIYNGLDYQERYQHYVDNPEAAMMREAKEFAAKQTYTNDPNVYGGVLAALARGAQTAQNKSLMVNMIIPFVRTPANLLAYSMDTIGANTVLSPGRTFNQIMNGTARESQEALSRLTVAAGLWLAVAEAHQNGLITGVGPSNWEERQVWEAAGWQANSVKIFGEWVDMSRADPFGQSLNTIATVFDYYALNRDTNKPGMEWVGAGLLYTSDMILDDSYLSTVSDVLTAISAKETSRGAAITASTINSVFIPNLLRDLRRPADETIRSTTSDNLMTQITNQMRNASPWHSENLPPKRDWRGEPVNYYGNAYVRGLVPFNMRDPESGDPASMAVAYHRIPVAKPNKTLDWPNAMGDGINLMRMDNGRGFVYDKYLEFVGQHRARAVNELINSPEWKVMTRDGQIGPGSDGEYALRKAIGIGSRNGRLAMLDFLIEHGPDNNTYRRGNGDLIEIQHPVSVNAYLRMKTAILAGAEVEIPEQYQITEPKEGPEFFKP